MSVSSGYQELKISVENRGEKIANKTQIHLAQSGDDNANQLPSVADRTGKGLIENAGYNTSSIPPLVSQNDSSDKLVIWGSEQQCMEPDIREFNLLESQEIHTFLGSRSQGGENEEDDDGGSLRDGKDEGPMSISSSSTASSASVGVRRNDNDSNHTEGRMESNRWVHKGIAYRSAEDLDTERMDTRSGQVADREKAKGGLKESKSETNVFVSSLSAVSLSGSLASALDSNGGTQPSYPVSKIKPYAPTCSSTSAQARRRSVTVEATQNSPLMLPQEKHPQILGHNQKPEGNQERNGFSYEAGLGQRRKSGFEERTMPPRRQQLVRPLFQTEMGRARSLEEASPHQAETRHPPIPASAESHINGSNRKFMKSSLQEPSDWSALYHLSGVSKVSQKVLPEAEKSLGIGPRCHSSPSNPSAGDRRPQTQLTYRRNCSSPNTTFIDSRSSTPPHSPLRTPQGSPRRQPTMYLISRSVSGVGRHVPSEYSPAVPTSGQGNGKSSIRPPLKTCISTSGIPKAPLTNQQSSNHTSSPKESSPSPKLKPKGVRPKIITYVRRNSQFTARASDGPYQVSSLPSRLSTHGHQTGTCPKESPKEPPKPSSETRGTSVVSASNLLYNKYCHEMQANIFPPGILNRTIRPPGHTHTVPPAHTHSHTAPPKLGSKADTFYRAPSEVGRSASFKEHTGEEPLQTRAAAQGGGSSSLLRLGRGMRLGLRAVTRTTGSASKGRGLSQGQKSTAVFNQPVQPVRQATCQKNKDNTDEVFTDHAPPAPEAATATTATAQPQAAPSRSLLPKAASQSGLRPPGFTSRVAAGRLAAFDFVRSSSVSSVTSAHSADSTQSDTCKTTHRLSVSEEVPHHRVTTGALTEHQRAHSLQPPSTPVLPRRFLPPQSRNSPRAGGRKEFQRSSEITRSLPSSPKRLAVVPPKPQSPVRSVQRPAAAVRGSAPLGSPRRVAPFKLQPEQPASLQREQNKEDQQKERDRQAEEQEKEAQREELQRLQGRCEQQERQLRLQREELRKTSLGFEAFIITTQHYCLKNNTTEENERRLSSEMQKIREEMEFNSVRWESLVREKAMLEAAFERELQELQLQQEAELAAVEEGLRKCHLAETEHLREEHRSEMEELRTQQQEQVEEMTVHHQAAVQELRDMHNITMATLHEEHARTMRDLRKAHDQQKQLLEEDFEKLRLSLQDQVDTLTFQNQSLRDKAKRFEDALRRSTDEQIIEALAPYQHIEKDLKSLKEVVEMKNQQIHQQEKKISDLEKVAQKNVFLEERVQVLQQQNEDLLAQIQINLSISRQLSEENANLHESVEKESTEKKRLSRNNEELLWRLQTSPLMSPASSPLHRPFSTSPIPSSPLFSSTPVAGCDSPTHSHGCPQLAQYFSPTHRPAANQNISPGPAAQRATTNQNYSPGPATPTHRANRCNPTSCLSSQQS